MLLCDLLIAKLIPVPTAICLFDPLSVEDYKDHGQYLIHTLLVAIVWVLSAPQVQQLRQQVLRLHLLEVVKLLHSPAHILPNQILHLFLQDLFFILVLLRRGQRIKVLVLLGDCLQTHALLEVGPLSACLSRLSNPGLLD